METAIHKLLLALVSATLIAATTPALSYPERPVRWVLGFAPGGAPDSVARIITPQLTAQMGQSMG